MFANLAGLAGSFSSAVTASLARPPAEPVGEGRSSDDAHNVGFLHDQKFIAIDLDLGTGPLGEQDLVTGLDIWGDELAGLVASARSDREDLALGGLLFGGIWDDDAAARLLLGLEAANDYAVVQRSELEFGHVFLVGAPCAASA